MTEETNIDQLRAMKMVQAIVDKGNLTAAAKLLDTSLPTVVRQLAKLEKYLDVTLFERTTRKIHITEEGEMYIATARKILKDTLDLEVSLTNRKNNVSKSVLQIDTITPSGNINITAPVLFGRMHVMPVINAYMARYSLVTTNVLLQDTLTDLVEAGIDVAFRVGEIKLPDVVAIKIGEVQQVVCASPNYLAKQPINEPHDLNQASCIKILALNKSNHWKLAFGDKKLDLKVPVTFTSNNIDAAIQHCVAGLGVGVFLSYQVKSLLQTGDLVVILQNYTLPSLPVSIIYPVSKRNLTRTCFFIDFAKELLKAEFERDFAIK